MSRGKKDHLIEALKGLAEAIGEAAGIYLDTADDMIRREMHEAIALQVEQLAAAWKAADKERLTLIFGAALDDDPAG